jgi:hypothetical protein
MQIYPNSATAVNFLQLSPEIYLEQALERRERREGWDRRDADH